MFNIAYEEIFKILLWDYAIILSVFGVLGNVHTFEILIQEDIWTFVFYALNWGHAVDVSHIGPKAVIFKSLWIFS